MKKSINFFTANFNKIVKAGITIKSFIFTFNIPDSDLRLNKGKLSQILNLEVEKPFIPFISQMHDKHSKLEDERFKGHTTQNVEARDSLLPLKHSVSVNPNSSAKLNSQVKISSGKKLSIKSKSFSSNTTNQNKNTCNSNIYQNVASYQVTNQYISTHTPFEKFLLSTTPYVTQLLENDSLLSIFYELENVWDLGVEIYYQNSADNSHLWDIYLPTLKSISWYIWDLSNSNEYKNYFYNEDEPLYQRVPFVDKIQDLSDSDPSSPFLTPIINIANSSSWISIEWNLHYTSNRLKQNHKNSITMYYLLDFKRYNSYLPVINWEVNYDDGILSEIYGIYEFSALPYQNFDVNMLIYK